METVGSILLSLLGLVGGSLFLYFGAEGLVRGSSSVAIKKGITPLVVGLTIVSFGTSSPELVVSVSAAIRGNPAIAFGNVVGSNICNIALILGVAALIRPIKVNMKLIKTDIVIMIGVTFLLILLVIDQSLSRLDGIIFIVGIIFYNLYTLKLAKKEKSDDLPVKAEKEKTWLDFLFILGGLVILVIGANLFLSGAVKIARYLGASDIIIGISIVALGTSLPELATSIVASIKNEGDISLGNVVGSNIFNILAILGIAALIQPIVLSGPNAINYVDVTVMFLVTIVLLPLAWSKLEVSRLEGVFLLVLYIGYIYYLYAFRLEEVMKILPR